MNDMMRYWPGFFFVGLLLGAIGFFDFALSNPNGWVSNEWNIPFLVAGVLLLVLGYWGYEKTH